MRNIRDSCVTFRVNEIKDLLKVIFDGGRAARRSRLTWHKGQVLLKEAAVSTRRKGNFTTEAALRQPTVRPRPRPRARIGGKNSGPEQSCQLTCNAVRLMHGLAFKLRPRK